MYRVIKVHKPPAPGCGEYTREVVLEAKDPFYCLSYAIDNTIRNTRCGKYDIAVEPAWIGERRPPDRIWFCEVRRQNDLEDWYEINSDE